MELQKYLVSYRLRSSHAKLVVSTKVEQIIFTPPIINYELHHIHAAIKTHVENKYILPIKEHKGPNTPETKEAILHLINKNLSILITKIQPIK